MTDMILALLNTVCPGWQPEYRFHSKRRWRFDYCLPEKRIAIEIEGGIWTKGRHLTGKGYLTDMEKYNAATLLGYRVLRYSPEQLGEMLHDVETLLSR